jgi:IS605 OrfB family transposase
LPLPDINKERKESAKMITIKSTKSTLHFANKNKQDKLCLFIDEYKNIMSQLIDIYWLMDKVPYLLPQDIMSQIKDKTWFSARALQCAGKQASGIVRGTREKQKRRLFMIGKLTEEGKFKRARKLQRIYDEVSISKPELDKVNPELDSRFIKMDTDDKSTSFDGWITLSNIGNKMKIELPFKKHKHFLKMEALGTIKKGVRISKNDITFMFEIENDNQMKKILNNEDKVIGIDIGQITTLTCSNGQKIEQDPHGHTYQSICDKLARKEYGSKAYQEATTHRDNFLHWSVNQLNLTGIQKIKIEDIKYLNKGRKTSKSLKHWNYRGLFNILETKLIDAGVQIEKVCSTYTSQRCSCCGWVCKKNRNGKWFECGKCGFTCDADLNGSINISLDLRPIRKKERRQRKNRKGFYWHVEGQEHIVPATQRSKDGDG